MASPWARRVFRPTASGAFRRLFRLSSNRSKICVGFVFPMADALTVVPGVPCTPESHLFEDGLKTFAALGQGILYFWGNDFVDLPMHQAVLFQLTKLLGQHLLTRAGDQQTKLPETQDTVRLEIKKQERFILSTDHGQRDFDGAKNNGLRVFGFQSDARLQKGA